jgi:hypothetical protein
MRLPLTSAARVGVLCVVGALACKDRPAGSPTSKRQGPVTVTAASAGDLIIYEARRDAYRRMLTARERRGENIEAAERAALRELESLLRPIVGDFSAPWVKRRGRMNQTTLAAGSEDSRLPDGILYQSRDSTIQVLVTTRDLMLSWIDSSFSGDTTVSRDRAHALANDDVLEQIFERGGAVYPYADIPVDSTLLGVVSAKLISRFQGEAGSEANEIMVSVARGTRIFVIDAPARDTLPIPLACSESVDSGKAISKALIDSAWQSTPQDTMLTEKAFQNDIRTRAQFRRCYGDAALRNPRSQALVAQVRELVESLPAR